jgi:hypothetical protein
MVVLLLTLLAALVSHEAQAGFIHPRATLSTLGVHAGLLGLPESFQDTALPGGMNFIDATGPSRPADDEESDDHSVVKRSGNLVTSEGACGAESFPQSNGGGLGNLAIYSATWPFPDRTPLARLPDEMGPHFSNPPPWAPLRPPCR